MKNHYRAWPWAYLIGLVVLGACGEESIEKEWKHRPCTSAGSGGPGPVAGSGGSVSSSGPAAGSGGSVSSSGSVAGSGGSVSSSSSGSTGTSSSSSGGGGSTPADLCGTSTNGSYKLD